jgi:hypothetical protein
MTLKDFIEKYDGKHTDYDGYYGAQCMDLMHRYIDEVVIGKPSPEVLRAPHAKAAYLNFTSNDTFKKIDNTPEGIPKPGDIMFWGGGTYGHVAIFINGNANDFTSFDQNYPLNSPCHKQYHNYTNVLGWLESRESCEQVLEGVRKSRDNWKKSCGDFEKQLEHEKKANELLLTQVKALQTDLAEFKVGSIEFYLLKRHIFLRITQDKRVPEGGDKNDEIVE